MGLTLSQILYKKISLEYTNKYLHKIFQSILKKTMAKIHLDNKYFSPLIFPKQKRILIFVV